jgi:pyruvate/2-oxoglutarate dehydrogenase complex dihydrolipoamide dehydrogenase (E3) component
MQRFDLIVLGAGSGGLTCAVGGTMLGARVLLIEKEKIGGDCLHYGCVPSKSLIRAANLVQETKEAERFGITVGSVSVNYQQVLDRVAEVIAGIEEEHESPKPLEAQGITVVTGTPVFTGRNTIAVGSETYTARRIVIATGGRPNVPNIPGLVEAGFITNMQLFSKKDLGQTIIVLGGGPIGSEMAQALQRLGKTVIQVDRGSQLLGKEDPEAGKLITAQFAKEGVQLELNSSPEQVLLRDGKKVVVVKTKDGTTKELVGDEILVALGRKPNVENLGLEKAGVEYNERGVIIDDYQRTTNKAIFACGDVCGPFQFTHLANYQGGIVLRNAFAPFPVKSDLGALPRCTYTDPEVASVGVTEAEAKAQGLWHQVFVYPVAEADRARAEGATDGFIKIIAGRRGKILGVVIASKHAGEILPEYVLAMRMGLTLRDIYGTIHAYPTWSDVARWGAFEYVKTTTTPAVKTFLKFWNRFGQK